MIAKFQGLLFFINQAAHIINNMKLNQTNIERIETKLDMIIRHFCIGQTPGRSKKELEDMATAKVLSLQKRRKKSMKKDVRAKNQRK